MSCFIPLKSESDESGFSILALVRNSAQSASLFFIMHEQNNRKRAISPLGLYRGRQKHKFSRSNCRERGCSLVWKSAVAATAAFPQQQILQLLTLQLLSPLNEVSAGYARFAPPIDALLCLIIKLMPLSLKFLTERFFYPRTFLSVRARHTLPLFAQPLIFGHLTSPYALLL